MGIEFHFNLRQIAIYSIFGAPEVWNNPSTRIRVVRKVFLSCAEILQCEVTPIWLREKLASGTVARGSLAFQSCEESTELWLLNYLQ